MLLKDKKILFIGDSITDGSRNRNDLYDLGKGYPLYVLEALKDIPMVILNKGISGNRTIDLLNRYEEDILKVKPDYLVLFIGINDIWHYFINGNYVSDEEFKHNYELLLQKVKSDLNIPIMIVEPFLIDVNNNKKQLYPELYQKIIIIRQLARIYASSYVPLDGIFSEMCLKEQPTYWSYDGIHPTKEGHQLIASEILKRLK